MVMLNFKKTSEFHKTRVEKVKPYKSLCKFLAYLINISSQNFKVYADYYIGVVNLKKILHMLSI